MKLPKVNFQIKSVTIPSFVKEIGFKYSTYILPAVSVLAAFVLIVGIVRPRVGTIFQLRSKIAVQQQQERVLKNKVATLKSFDADQLLLDTRKAEIALPSEKDLPGLLFVIERLAVETGVKIAAIQSTPGLIVPEQGKTEAENFPVKMTIEGDFFQVRSFLASIINSSRKLGVKTLSITSGVGAQQLATLSATLNLESFFQSLGKTKFTVGEPLQQLSPDEQQILGKITLPVQVEITQATPSAVTGKANPFAPF